MARKKKNDTRVPLPPGWGAAHHPYGPGHWFGLLPGQVKRRAYRTGIAELAERWQDEASEAAVAIESANSAGLMSGNPQRAGYIEHMVVRLQFQPGV
jgi:hypothetical protein